MEPNSNEAIVNQRMQRAVDAVVASHAGSGDVDGAVAALKQAMLANGLTPQTGSQAEGELRRVAGKVAQLPRPAP